MRSRKVQIQMVDGNTLSLLLLCLRPHGAEALSNDACLTSVCLSWRMSVAYIGPKSRGLGRLKLAPR